MEGRRITKIEDSLDKNDYFFLFNLIRNLSLKWDEICLDSKLVRSLTLGAQDLNPLLISKKGVFVAWLDQNDKVLECRGFVFPQRILILNALHAGSLGINAILNSLSSKAILTKIEIYLVNQIENISSINEIEIGKHGLILMLSENLGSVQLPHVPVRENLNQEDFYQRGLEKIKLKEIDIKTLKMSTFTVESYRELDAKYF